MSTGTAICGLCGDPYAGHGLAGHGGVSAHRYRAATDEEREAHLRTRAWEYGVGHGIAPILLDDGRETADAVVSRSNTSGGRILVVLERADGTRYRAYTSQVELDKRASSVVR